MELKSKTDKNIYFTRRKRIIDQLKPNSIAVLSGASLQYRNHDAEYPFRQNSAFYYLTGFCEPDSILILLKDSDSQSSFILFCPAKNEEEEIWSGPRAGLAEAMAIFGADRAYEIQTFDEIIPTLLADRDNIYYTLGQTPTLDQKMIQCVNELRHKIRSGMHAPESWLNFTGLIAEARIFKSKPEIELLKKACDISARAHVLVMQQCKPDRFEYALEATFVNECNQQGARFMAYTPIVAGGKNACTLHYVQNDNFNFNRILFHFTSKPSLTFK